MRLNGYGYSGYDEHGYKYQTNGLHFCTVSRVDPTPFFVHTYYWGFGKNWICIYDTLKKGNQIYQATVEDSKNHKMIARITQCELRNYTDYYYNIDDQIIWVYRTEGRFEFRHNGVLIGYDSNIRNANGETITHLAAHELRVSEFEDSLDRKLVMLLLGTCCLF